MKRIEKKKQEKGFISGNRSFRFTDDEGNIWHEIELNGDKHFVRKIDSTHFAMVFDVFDKGIQSVLNSSRPAIYHVRQFVDNPDFYEDLVAWLHGKEMIGGKSFQESKKSKTITLPEDVTIDMGDKVVILEKGERVEVMGKVEENYSYYLGQMQNVFPVDKYGVRVQFTSSSGKTKWMAIDSQTWAAMQEIVPSMVVKNK